MKLKSMLLETSFKENNMDELAQEAQDCYDNGDYHRCELLINLYQAKRAAGETPGFPKCDGWITELKKDLDEELNPSSSGGSDDWDGSDGSYYSGYDDREGNLEADASDYRNPDTFYDPHSYTLVYAENGELVIDEYPTTHTDLVTSKSVRAKIFAGTPDEADALRGWGPERSYVNAEKYCLFGRIDESAGHVSFWNMDREQVERLLPPCIERLLSDGHIVSETIVMAPPLSQSVPASEIGQAQTRDLDPEAEERLRLQQRMHLAVGAEKEAIRKKLGMAVVPGKPHPMTTAMRQAGHLVPGQKWWAGTSEGFVDRLSAVLGG